ncbi:thioredoxin domain-containing protein [soil metagenome]
MNRKVLTTLAAVVLVIAGFIWLTKPKPQSSSSASKPSSHIEGKGSAGVTLVEYGDYQCPACRAYHPVVKALAETYKDRIFFQFRNYPLESLHQNARAGARAAEAANIQGKFWEMHDSLYENQTAWESVGDPLTLYTSYAKQIGITDIAKFTTDYKSSAVNNIINADLKEGQKFTITGTPTFILNGKKIDNPRDQPAFTKVIDDAIAAKKKTSK